MGERKEERSGEAWGKGGREEGKGKRRCDRLADKARNKKNMLFLSSAATNAGTVEIVGWGGEERSGEEWGQRREGKRKVESGNGKWRRDKSAYENMLFLSGAATSVVP